METRPVLHLIGNAHLDPVWLWPWRDGFSEALTTLQSAVNFLESEPDFKFTRSSSEIYRWVEAADPRLFASIREHVGTGRWEIVGGWTEQPDCNLPSTESFTRQSLYGKRYFKETFGIDVKIGYNVDSFGHSAGLPQLLSRAGFTHYVFMRPSAWERDLPPLFWWESDDGSRILAWRLTRNYGQPPHFDADHLEEEIRQATDTTFKNGLNQGMFFYGVGNHGGGPTRIQLDRIRLLQQDASLPELRFSTVSEFFKSIEDEPALAKIPTIKGELNKHSPGCYSAHRQIKFDNRRVERLLPIAETAVASARIATGDEMQNVSIQRPWEHLLFNQFHDILCGTCTESNDVSIRDRFGAAAHPADESKVVALHRIARSVDLSSDVPEGALFVWNPLPWDREARICFDTFERPNGGDALTRLRALDDGSLSPIQWSKAEPCFGPMGAPWRKLNAIVSLPPCGYRVFTLERSPMTAPRPGFDIETASDTPGVITWGSKQLGPVFEGPLSFGVWKDTGDTWGHRLNAYDEKLGQPHLESTETLISGPLLHVVRQVARWNRSEIQIDYKQWRNLPGIQISIRFNWQENGEILRLEIPTRLSQSKTVTPVPGGMIERPADTGEQPGGEWVALEGAVSESNYTVLLVTDGGLSYSADQNVLKAIVARSGYYAHHRPNQPSDSDRNPRLDQGWQEANFWIHAKKGSVPSIKPARYAAEALNGAEIVSDSAHPGDLPTAASLLSIDAPHVVLTGCKIAEDGQHWIVRLHETGGAATRVLLSSQFPAKRQWGVELTPFAIATYRLPFTGDDDAIPVDFLEQRTS